MHFPSELPSEFVSAPLQKRDSNLNLPLVKPFMRMSSRFEKTSSTHLLPDQEEFFLRHVIHVSESDLSTTGNCSLCNQSNEDKEKRAVRITKCGHYLHERCLIANFRLLDSSIGACPICSTVLCERNLADRIDTDRTAIFGSQSTPLRSEVQIDFLHRGQTARLLSEEELAAGQLRLLKDYIDMHAEDVVREWGLGQEEPDWYTGVVCPVVQLFKGWTLLLQQSRYFSDQAAFLKLVAWAELVRLVNVTRSAGRGVEGQEMPFCSLDGLHDKFALALERYDVEKKTWKTNHRGVLDCEKVVKDVCDLAVLAQDTKGKFVAP